MATDLTNFVKGTNSTTELAELVGHVVIAGCPSCGVCTEDMESTEVVFGFRRMTSTRKDGSKRTVTRVQSHCRKCRSAEAKARRQGKRVTHRAWLLSA